MEYLSYKFLHLLLYTCAVRDTKHTNFVEFRNFKIIYRRYPKLNFSFFLELNVLQPSGFFFLVNTRTLISSENWYFFSIPDRLFKILRYPVKYILGFSPNILFSFSSKAKKLRKLANFLWNFVFANFFAVTTKPFAKTKIFSNYFSPLDIKAISFTLEKVCFRENGNFRKFWRMRKFLLEGRQIPRYLLYWDPLLRQQ